MAASVAEIADSFFRPAVQGLVPYEPGKPVEEVQRELGLARCVKLASNEGPFGPFPAALEALHRSVAELNRYPDGGAWRLRTALAERHGVSFEEVAVGAGADGLIDCLSQASLDPGDEIVCGWPSFPSYVIDAAKLGAAPVKVPLRDDRYDLDAMLEAITPRTNLVFVCHPNNPTGTMNTRAELDAFLDRVPDHVLVVIDQAYREYIDDPDYPDAIEEYYRAGRPVAVLRTFSKIYGLAGLRVGYMVAPAGRGHGREQGEARLRRLHRGPGGGARQPRRRRRGRSPPAAERGVARPAPARSSAPRGSTCRTGVRELRLRRDRRRHAAAVRGAARRGRDRPPAARVRIGPTAIRVTCGTPDENAFFAEALARVRDPAPGALTSPPCRPSSPASGRCSAASPSFRLLFGSTLISGLGTWIAVIALVIDIKDRTGSGGVGERAADRRLPARRSRSGCCSGRSSTGSRGSACSSAPTSYAGSRCSSCSRSRSAPGRSSRSR